MPGGGSTRAGSGEITDFEVIPYSLPFESGYTTARGTLRRREMVLLRVRDADGLVGLGEAVPLSLRGGASLETVVTELNSLRDEYQTGTESSQYRLLKDAFDRFSAPSRCALQTVSLDLGAKQQGLPAWKLLGGQGAAPLPCNATLTVGEVAEVAEQALAWAEEGFSTFKLKVGVENDVDQVAAVRMAVGEGAELRIDANAAWSAEEAITKVNLMAEHRIELAEQPCSTLGELGEVRASTPIPIVADESIETPEDAKRAVEAGACDLATIKLSKVGGAMPAIGIARAVSSYVSSALDGPVGIAAAAHIAQSLYPGGAEERCDENRESARDPKLAHGLATQRLFAETIAGRECELRDGFLHLPEGPGLGVEIDDAALERARL